MNNDLEKTLDLIMKLLINQCQENGVEFLLQFRFNDQSTSTHTSGMVMDASDIITQIQLWEAKNGRDLF